MKKEGIRIGLFSRTDAGSDGYRRGLINKAFEAFGAEKTHFNVLLGGLVSKEDITKLIKNEIALVKEKNKQEEKKEKIDKEAIGDMILDALAKELSEAIPHLPRPIATQNGKLARLYIMSSPAYDGAYGEKVAYKLTQLRPDIRYWSEADEHFPLKGINKKLLGLVPKKRPMPSEYDSASVDREIKNHQKRTTRLLPDLYTVGCFASSIFKPRGEAKRHYLSVPALVKTSENQIGVTIVEVFLRNEEVVVAKRTHSFKDLVSREREFIEIPSRCSETQKKILTTLRERGTQTIGLFEDATGICREKLMPCLKKMLELERFQPRICYDKASERYDFDTEWIQTNLVYPNGEQEYQEDVMVGFGCLHAGSVHTDYKFFVDEVPNIILESGAKFLVGIGDLLKGLKHNLILQGEVIGGLNYTSQEILAAHIVARVIIKVFKALFQKAIEPLGEKRLTEEELRAIVLDILITFLYIEGNHDEWEEDEGFTPLNTFKYELRNVLRQEISKILSEKGYNLPGLEEIIDGKVIKSNLYTLPSGLSMEMFHPHMARAKTTVLRVQDSLEKSKSQIMWVANFHVATSIERYDPEVGQRVAVQVGAIEHKTKFEAGKGKKLDTGVALLRVRSRNQRIVMSEQIFHMAPPKETEYNNEGILTDLEKKMGIR